MTYVINPEAPAYTCTKCGHEADTAEMDKGGQCYCEICGSVMVVWEDLNED